MPDEPKPGTKLEGWPEEYTIDFIRCLEAKLAQSNQETKRILEYARSLEHAANRLPALEAEVERLRKALEELRFRGPFYPSEFIPINRTEFNAKIDAALGEST